MSAEFATTMAEFATTIVKRKYIMDADLNAQENNIKKIEVSMNELLTLCVDFEYIRNLISYYDDEFTCNFKVHLHNNDFCEKTKNKWQTDGF